MPSSSVTITHRAVGEVRERVNTVNELAEQSNLLAVNAGIEAAKAGEHGRGLLTVSSLSCLD